MSNGASNKSFNSDIPAERWERSFMAPGESPDHDCFCDGCDECQPPARVEQPHECEECGKKMKYADQRCGCTAKRP